MMYMYLELPQEVYLYQLYHMIAFMKKYHNYELVLDPSDTVIHQAEF